jgi:DNA polymerase delta subunit 1
MFGVNAASNSVAMHVHNFTPYFYVKVAGRLGQEDLVPIKDALNKFAASEGGPPAVKAVELVRDKASVMHYQAEKGIFLKIFTGLPRHVNQLRTLFEQGQFSYRGDGMFETVTYESNLPYALRFMIDQQVVGMSWIRVKAGCYRHKTEKLCNTQYEIDVEDFNDVECLPCEGEYSKIAPVRILSFDIECSADKGKFPQA